MKEAEAVRAFGAMSQETRRQGRSIVYSAIFPVLADLVAFLMHDCCDGHCAYCNKAIELFAQCEGRPTSPGTVDSKI